MGIKGKLTSWAPSQVGTYLLELFFREGKKKDLGWEKISCPPKVELFTRVKRFEKEKDVAQPTVWTRLSRDRN